MRANFESSTAFLILALTLPLTLALSGCSGGGGGGGAGGAAPNSPPQAVSGSLLTTINTPANGILSATDPDNDPLSISIFTPPSKGSITTLNTTTGAYTYTPNSGASGTDLFKFEANDGHGNSAQATVTVAINIAPDLHYYVAIGDSITEGYGDNYAADDTSQDGRNTGGGFEPVLNNLLTAATGTPHTIQNEGCGGATSADGLYGNSTIPCDGIATVLGRHAGAQRYLVLYGMNDARPWLPVPSGQGLTPGNPGYSGTFKDNMQRIIDAIHAAGKEVALAKTPIALADCSNANDCTGPYPDPNTGARSVLIQQYNIVIDELKSIQANSITVTPPDLYAHFATSYSTEYFDWIHPNGVGYQSIAGLWRAVLAP